MIARFKDIKFPRSVSWKRVVTFCIMILVFSYLIYRAFNGVKEIASRGIEFNYGYLLISFSSQVIGVGFALFVWSNIVHRLSVHSSPKFDSETWLVSAVARKIPGTIWYAVSRMYIYEMGYKVSKTLIMIAVLIEAIIISLGGVVALGISIIFGFVHVDWINPKLLLFVVIPVLIIICIVLGPRIINFAVRKTIKNQHNQDESELSSIRSWDTLQWICGETIVAFFAGAMCYFLMKSIIGDVAVPFTTIVGALSIAIAFGPISMWLPGDIGLKDGFLYLALSSILGGSLAAVIALSWRLWGTLLELIFGGIAGIALSRDFRKNNINIKLDKGSIKVDRNSSF